MWVGLVLDSDRSLYIVVTIKNLGLNQVVVQVYAHLPHTVNWGWNCASFCASVFVMYCRIIIYC